MKAKKRLIGPMIFLLGLVQVLGGAEVKPLTLEKALSLGEEANYELKMAKLRLDNARLDYEKNKATNQLAVSRYADLQREKNLLEAQAGYEQTRNQVLLAIAQTYLEIGKVNREKLLRSKAVEYEAQLLQDLDAQVELGYKTRIELLKQENEYHSARLALRKTEDQHNQLLRNLEAQIGVAPGELQVALEECTTPTGWSLSLEESRALARQNSLNLRSLDLGVELAELDWERGQVGPLSAWEANKLENNLKLARLARERALADLDTSVVKQYATVRQKEEELAINRTHLLTVQTNYKKIQQQQAVGLINRTDRIAAEVELLQAEYQALVTVSAFLLEKWKLQQLLGLELEGN
ncbi:MAG: TolC family protein [Firmicutes bacterium]|nr:TolC family protein [Bacillota bacterium]